MELDLDWKGICVEPHPDAFSRLDKNRNCKKSGSKKYKK